MPYIIYASSDELYVTNGREFFFQRESGSRVEEAQKPYTL